MIAIGIMLPPLNQTPLAAVPKDRWRKELALVRKCSKGPFPTGGRSSSSSVEMIQEVNSTDNFNCGHSDLPRAQAVDQARRRNFTDNGVAVQFLDLIAFNQSRLTSVAPRSPLGNAV